MCGWEKSERKTVLEVSTISITVRPNCAPNPVEFLTIPRTTDVDEQFLYTTSPCISATSDAWRRVQGFAICTIHKCRSDKLSGFEGCHQKFEPCREREWRLVHVLNKDTGEVAENNGFLMFKYRFIVSFYTNDMAGTPHKRMQKENGYTVYCVLSLKSFPRWNCDEAAWRSTQHVLSKSVAYNVFENGAEHLNKIRTTSATQRKGKRATMSILSFILDASIINTLSPLKAISNVGEHIINPSTMKQQVISQPVAQPVRHKQE